MAKQSIQERFWSKVDKSGECWLWTDGRFANGYGSVWFNKRNHLAHRIAWELTHGQVPIGTHHGTTCVCHRCDNHLCVNPSHLFLGTAKDNTMDMIAKGRASIGKLHSARLHPARGEGIACAKLTADKVRAIRADSRLMRIIAADYGVSLPTVSEIKRLKTWAHVI